eukprot:scaffold1380_cov290-Chaetoceros_neogracile.AAC.12
MAIEITAPIIGSSAASMEFTVKTSIRSILTAMSFIQVRLEMAFVMVATTIRPSVALMEAIVETSISIPTVVLLYNGSKDWRWYLFVPYDIRDLLVVNFGPYDEQERAGRRGRTHDARLVLQESFNAVVPGCANFYAA